jgi:hypothetical protein
MTDQKPEPFVPSSRQDWAEAFADGIEIARNRREEAEAKAKAAQAANGATTDGGGTGDSGDSKPKPGLAERILGSIR